MVRICKHLEKVKCPGAVIGNIQFRIDAPNFSPEDRFVSARCLECVLIEQPRESDQCLRKGLGLRQSEVKAYLPSGREAVGRPVVLAEPILKVNVVKAPSREQ